MFEELKKRLDDVRENEPMSGHTTFKIGGPARYFFTVKSSDDMVRALNAAVEFGVPFFILGGGSNILVSDGGFDGLVILNQIHGFTSHMEGDHVVLTAGAGENWDDIVARCVQNNWVGIECLSGIPGTVGAAPVQNIGAYGQSVGTVIKEVRAIDCKTRNAVQLDSKACAFGYRDSIFKKDPGQFIITHVTFTLTPYGKPIPAYHDLQNYFAGRPAPTLAEVRRAVIEIRAGKGYVIMPGYECYKTAGSFFINPVISQNQFQKLQQAIQGCADPWYWQSRGGEVKVSAACLLQSAGFYKGYRRGNAGISPKHSLSLVNFGGASAYEIAALAKEIEKTVCGKFGLKLKEEVQLVGF